MRPAVCVQTGEIEAGCFVHQAAIFGAERPMLRENVVRTHTVEEGSPSLLRGARKTVADVPSWIKYQSTAACQCVWLNPSKTWQFHHSCASDLMDVGLDSSWRAPEINLRGAVIPVVCLLKSETASCNLPHNRLTIDSKHRISLQGKSHAKRRGIRK